MRRQRAEAEIELSRINAELLEADVRKSLKVIADDRKAVNDAYHEVENQLGSDAPTLPDCLMESSSESDAEMDLDDEDEDEDEGRRTRATMTLWISTRTRMTSAPNGGMGGGMGLGRAAIRVN